jgi:anti-anti-sigma factor
MSATPISPRSNSFSIDVEFSPDHAIAHCAGRLVAEHTEDLKSAVKPLLAQTKAIHIDLANVTYIDSAGLGAIVSLYTSARTAHCDLKLVNFNADIRNLLRITNLLWVLE